MTLPSSGPISFSEIIGESSYGFGQLSKQDQFVREKSSDQYRVGDVSAPNFVDEYGQVIPGRSSNIKISEFYQFDGYDDNNFLISEFEDGTQAHSNRIKDTGAFLITDDNGVVLRTDDKVGNETIIKHKSESSSGGEVYLFAEFCRNFGFPYTRVFYEFTNNGNIENLYIQESSWPANSEIILVNNGTVTNPLNYGSYTQLL